MGKKTAFVVHKNSQI